MSFQLKILYEDNHLIAVFKPAGVLVQGDKSGDISLMDEVKKHLKEKYKKPGNVFLGLLHRLDRPVSGIVLFAKTSKGAARLSEQIREREITKIYHAVIAGKIIPPNGVLRNYISKDTKRRIAKIVGSPGNTDESTVPYFQHMLKIGDMAELHYKTIKSNGRYSLLRIELITGRFHQIRAQFAAAGHPIMGDAKYGGAAAGSNGMALCATELTFQTATTGETKTLKIHHPDSWNTFFK